MPYTWKWGGLVLLCVVCALLASTAPTPAQSQGEEDVLALLAKGPALGSAQAPVTIIEFSDFQCTFCVKFWRETLPRLEAEYVRPGKVRFVYRHLAILGRQSLTSAEAADCAAEQGKFWEYHDMLFASRGPLALTTASLKSYAGKVGLDEQAFARCLDSGKYAQKVKEETNMALAIGARATPVFLINGRMLVGAHPFETFRASIEEELRASRKDEGAGKEKK